MAAAMSNISTPSNICSPFLASPRPFSPRSSRKYAKMSRPTKTALAVRRSDSEADHHHDDRRRDYSGRTVDENMTVLRKRIHEMKMAERNYAPPSEWMEWEKSCYTSYDSVICEAVGALQLLLMNSRPSLAVGIIALVSLSVPTSLFVVISQLVGLSNGVLSGIHLP